MGNCGSSSAKTYDAHRGGETDVPKPALVERETENTHVAGEQSPPAESVATVSSSSLLGQSNLKSFVSTDHINDSGCERISDSPMPLLQLLPDASNNLKWHLFEDTLDLISSIKDKVAVISVVGQYRTGKSYLMNRFMEQPNGFELGHKVAGKTRGIWVWGRATRDENGEEKYVLLLDSEGLSDALRNAGAGADASLFSMLIMLSSVLIYNVLSTITEDNVEKLSCVTELTEFIKVKKHTKEKTDADFSQVFPELWWVVRDFYLEGDSDYLEDVLKDIPGGTKVAHDKNYLRQCIRRFFTSRKLYAIPRPVADEERLRNLDAVPVEEIRLEFQDKMHDLIQAALAAPAKRAPSEQEEVAMTGEGYVHFVREIVKMYNSGELPCLETAGDAMSSAQCKKASKEAIQRYDELMAPVMQRFPMDVDELLNSHHEAMEESRKLYSSRAVGSQHLLYLEECMTTLLESDEENNTVGGRLLPILKLNEEKSRIACEQFLEHGVAELNMKLEKKSLRDRANYDDEVESMLDRYNSKCVGPMKGEVKLRYRKNQLAALSKLANTRFKLDATAREKVKLEQLNKELEAEKEKASEEAVRLANEHKMVMQSHKAIVGDLERRTKDLERQTEEKLKYAAKAHAHLTSQLKASSTLHTEFVKKAEQDKQALVASLRETERRMAKANEEDKLTQKRLLDQQNIQLAQLRQEQQVHERNANLYRAELERAKKDSVEKENVMAKQLAEQREKVARLEQSLRNIPTSPPSQTVQYIYSTPPRFGGLCGRTTTRKTPCQLPAASCPYH